MAMSANNIPLTRAIGIFGGTFDPVHVGHIRLAQEVQQHLALDEMRLMPCRVPPHRPPPAASEADRLQMLRLASAGTNLQIDDRELKREGPSYAVDTLENMRREYGERIALVWCLGMDAFAAFHTWHRWRDILALAHLAVLVRPGTTPELSPELRDVLQQRLCQNSNALKLEVAGQIYLTQLAQIPVSSTEIRQQLSQGALKPENLHPDVLRYIEERGLYRNR